MSFISQPRVFFQQLFLKFSKLRFSRKLSQNEMKGLFLLGQLLTVLNLLFPKLNSNKSCSKYSFFQNPQTKGIKIALKMLILPKPLFSDRDRATNRMISKKEGPAKLWGQYKTYTQTFKLTALTNNNTSNGGKLESNRGIPTSPQSYGLPLKKVIQEINSLLR